MSIASPISTLQTDIPSAKEALRFAVLRLQQARIESASLDARLLLEHVLGIRREQLLFSLDLPLTSAQYARLETLVEKRCLRQPIAQLLGKREFWGLNFSVTGATLDPRPDSETVIESILARVANRTAPLRVLDLGTGTGCLLLSLLSEWPNARGVGVDCCEKALNVARENAVALGLAERVTWVHSNWFEQVEGVFDVIVSNPPYIPTGVIPTLEPEVAQFEPKQALDGGEDGLMCYQAIIEALPNRLAPGGFAAFELGIGQQQSVEALAHKQGLEVVAVKHDLGGIARSLVVQNKTVFA